MVVNTEYADISPESMMAIFGARKRDPRRTTDDLRDQGLAALFKELGNESSPPSLVTRSNPSAIFAMEILVEMNAVAPVRIALKVFEPAIHGTLSIRRTKEK